MNFRLLRWFCNTKSALKRRWWWWRILFLSAQVWEVAKHRFYGWVNAAIDAHSGKFLQHAKPYILYLVTNPLLVSLLAFIIVVCVIVVHAYIDTLPRYEDAGCTEAGAVDARTRKEIYTIDWRYLPTSPLERGWKVAYQDRNPAPHVEFLAPVDSAEAGGLMMQTDNK